MERNSLLSCYVPSRLVCYIKYKPVEWAHKMLPKAKKTRHRVNLENQWSGVLAMSENTEVTLVEED